MTEQDRFSRIRRLREQIQNDRVDLVRHENYLRNLDEDYVNIEERIKELEKEIQELKASTEAGLGAGTTLAVGKQYTIRSRRRLTIEFNSKFDNQDDVHIYTISIAESNP